MEKPGSSTLGILILLMSLCCFVVFGPWIGEAFDCCPPPVDPASARFPQNAQVTVYLNTTGLTDTEVNAITMRAVMGSASECEILSSRKYHNNPPANEETLLHRDNEKIRHSPLTQVQYRRLTLPRPRSRV